MQDPIQFAYPHSAETVLAMFRDPAYITRKHAQLRQRNIRILEATDKPERYRLTVRRDARGLLSGSVPEFAQSFLSGLGAITTTIEWDLRDPTLYIGRNTIVLENMPLKAHIDYWLIPRDGSCMHRQLIHARVDVPLLRERLERFALQAIRDIQVRDYEYNLDYLSQPPLPLAASA